MVKRIAQAVDEDEARKSLKPDALVGFWLENGRFPNGVPGILAGRKKLRMKVRNTALDLLTILPDGQQRDRAKALIRKDFWRSSIVEKMLFLHLTGRFKMAALLARMGKSRLFHADIRDQMNRTVFLLARNFQPDVPAANQADMPDIFQFWDKQLPDDVADIVDGWRRIVGVQKHHLYDDAEARALVLEHCGDDAANLWDTIWTASIKSDLFRFVVLDKFGGVYIDADLIAQPNAVHVLSYLNNKNAALSRIDRGRSHFTHMFLSAKAGDPLLSACITAALDNIAHETDMSPMDIAGPNLFTDQLLENGDPNLTWHLMPNAYVGENLLYDAVPAYKETDLHWQNARLKRLKSDPRRGDKA